METAKKPAARYLQGALIAVCVICLIYCGIISWAFTDDVSRYQCYAVAFRQGWSGFQHLPSGQCKFITTPQEGQSSVYQQNLRTMQDWKLPSGLIQFVAAQQIGQPYYTLPFEYPLLVLVLFALWAHSSRTLVCACFCILDVLACWLSLFRSVALEISTGSFRLLTLFSSRCWLDVRSAF